MNTEAFLNKLFGDLAAGRYSLAAWGQFWREAWRRSVHLRAAEPGRVRAFMGWAGLGLLLGSGVLGGAAAGGAIRIRAGTAGPWLIWYTLSGFWMWLHLGRIRREDGTHFAQVLIPNGLSFLRLGLAPLAATPLVLGGPQGDAVTRASLVAVLAILALSDLADGWLARRFNQHSVLGRVLDPMADLALLSFLAYGLWRAGSLPTTLFVLLLLRYPGALLAAITLYVARGPSRITATLLGKLTTAATFILLCATAAHALLRPAWIPAGWMHAALHALSALVAANIVYLVYRATLWSRSGH